MTSCLVMPGFLQPVREKTGMRLFLNRRLSWYVPVAAYAVRYGTK